MKMLMVSGNAPPVICGIGDYSRLLSEALQDQGIQVVHVGCSEHPGKGFFKGWKLLLQIHSRQRQEKFDLVHLQYEAFSFGQSFLLPLYLTWQKVPLVVTFHEVFQKNIFQRWRDRLLACRARALIVTDTGRAKSLLSLIQQERPICVWGVGSNLPFFFGPLSETPLVGYFGFINAVKGLRTLFFSFSLVKKVIPSLRLRLIGQFHDEDVEIQKWRRWIEQEGLSQDVEWLNSLKPSAASQAIQECWVMALPFTDGASARRGSLQACLALNKAVVTTEPEERDPNLAGLCVVSGLDPAIWAQSLERILRDPLERKKAESSSSLIAQNYQWSHLAQKHRDLYLGLLRPS